MKRGRIPKAVAAPFYQGYEIFKNFVYLIDGDAVDSAPASRQEGPGVGPPGRMQDLSVWSLCSPRVCMSFRQLPPTVQVCR